MRLWTLRTTIVRSFRWESEAKKHCVGCKRWHMSHVPSHLFVSNSKHIGKPYGVPQVAPESHDPPPLPRPDIQVPKSFHCPMTPHPPPTPNSQIPRSLKSPMTYPQRLSPPHDLSPAPTFRLSGHSYSLEAGFVANCPKQLHYLGCRFRKVTTSMTSQLVLLIVCLCVHLLAYLLVCLKQDTCIGLHMS